MVLLLVVLLAVAASADIHLPTVDEVNNLQTTKKVQRSINDHAGVDNTEDTVREVERLILSNPELPRLTRGEILDILENITKHDQSLFLKSIGKESKRDPKALMVVKAYSPQGSEEFNMEEFYTKQPVTTIIEDDVAPTMSSTSTTTKTVPTVSTTTTEYSYRRKTTKKPSIPPKKKPSRGSTYYKISTEATTTAFSRTTERSTTTTRSPIKRRRRPTFTTTTTTPMPVTTYRPRRRQPPREEIEYLNHKYPDSLNRPSYPPPGVRIVAPPILSPPPSEINAELEDLLPQEVAHQPSFRPMPQTPSFDLEIPEHLKQVASDLNLARIPQAAATDLRQKERNEIDRINNILKSMQKPRRTTTTSTTSSPDALMVADSLSPDMQEILKNFGLLPNPNEIPTQAPPNLYQPERAIIDPHAYEGFKRIPDPNRDNRREMEDLLASFGLLERQSKSLKKRKEQTHLDVVPDNLKPVLEGIQFESNRLARKIRQQPDDQVVFSPLDPTKYVAENEMQKLARLLEIMKKLERINGTITEDKLDDIDKDELRELISSLNQSNQENIVTLDEQIAPNPIDFDNGLSKNEVKREEDEKTTEKVEVVTAETEETKTPSLKDLENSFGGSTETVTEALPEPTTPKRSGFYYLLDWNSFYEIDDQKGKRVNLRFQPKVGDPKRFYSVNIP